MSVQMTLRLLPPGWRRSGLWDLAPCRVCKSFHIWMPEFPIEHLEAWCRGRP